MLPIVAFADTASVLEGPRAEGAVLTLDERRRRAALDREADRDDFLAARVLVRDLLRRFRPGAEGADFAQRCDDCGGAHGRPTIPAHTDLVMSWSHAAGVVAAALATSPIGVDVARVDELGPPILPRIGGVEGWVRWTRTEALVKRGDGTLFEIRAWPLGGSAKDAPVAGVLTDFVADDQAWVASVAAEKTVALVTLASLRAE